MSNGVSSVPMSTRVVFRVFLFEEGCWVPVSRGFESVSDAAYFAGPLLEQHGDTVIYAVRPCRMWLN